MKILKYSLFLLVLNMSCQPLRKAQDTNVKLITLDPGHFHAALVQKSMYADVDSVVHVYAPAGQDLELHLEKIKAYNTAQENPTHWQEEIYRGEDFLAKMLQEKKGNVVVIAGNNYRKTEYIDQSIKGGFNVLADKPMAINQANFEILKSTFAEADKKDLLLYDIMTERYEITNIIQKELIQLPEVFGSLEKGSPDKPAVEMESVHYFYKYVSGKVLTRPSWFMDITQQGEGIADVAVHLVDLVQWSCFPNQVLNYEKDVKLNSASRWSTDMDLKQFSAITKQDTFPKYLQKDIENGMLKVYANGEINYKLKDIHVRVKALWDYQAKEGGDTHAAIFRGTKANVVIRQGVEQNFKPTLYIEPVQLGDRTAYLKPLQQNINLLQKKYPGIAIKETTKGWEVVIPEKYKEGHEAHFAQVTTKFLEYLKKGNIPNWEVPNMIAKYYTTTQALAKAQLIKK